MAVTTGYGTQWEQLANAINDYYGGGVMSPQYTKVRDYINSGQYTQSEMEAVLKQIPELDRTYNKNGQLVSVNYKANLNKTGSTAYGKQQASGVNSNVQNGTANTQNNIGLKEIQNVTKNATTQKTSISNELTKWRGGTPSTGQAFAGAALSGVCAVGMGISLGKTIDRALYNAYPDFWNSHGMSGLNPDSWNNLTLGDNSLGASLINVVLDLDPSTGNPTMYIDENMASYLAKYMHDTRLLTGVTSSQLEDTSILEHGDDWVQPVMQSHMPVKITLTDHGDPYTNIYWINYSGNAIPIICKGDIGYPKVAFFNTSPFTIRGESILGTGEVYETVDISSTPYTYNGVTYYYVSRQTLIDPLLNALLLSECNRFNSHGYDFQWLPDYCHDMCKILFLGETSTNQYDGVSDQPGAILPQLNDNMSLDEVLQALKNTYPNMWDNKIQYSPDGENTYTYVPIGFPTGGTANQPTSEGGTQNDPSPDIRNSGNNATDELVNDMMKIITDEKSGADGMTPNPPGPYVPHGHVPDDGGSGSTPTPIIPVGSASALWKIYNPSQQQLDTFGGWLWSSDFVDQLLKVFNDPMQAIIGLHKIFVTPSTSGSGPIKVGYLTSNANANYVSSQYVDLDCGTVSLQEYYGNVFDYEPYTQIRLFLPFIGVVDLSNSDVMRGNISVKYHVDVLTGSCLAEVSVKRDAVGGILYTYSGNCAVQYPVSSGSYVGIITGLLGIAGSLATGSAVPALLHAGASVGRMHTDVKHSGNISANSGAMGVKKPYLIIERVQPKVPTNGDMIEGRPENTITSLSAVKGFVKVKKCHYDGIPCTANELDRIKELLENGVYIN